MYEYSVDFQFLIWFLNEFNNLVSLTTPLPYVLAYKFTYTSYISSLYIYMLKMTDLNLLT